MCSGIFQRSLRSCIKYFFNKLKCPFSFCDIKQSLLLSSRTEKELACFKTGRQLHDILNVDVDKCN